MNRCATRIQNLTAATMMLCLLVCAMVTGMGQQARAGIIIDAAIDIDDDDQGSPTDVANGFTGLAGNDGNSTVINGVTYTLFGGADDRDRGAPDDLLRDFVFRSGEPNGGAVALRIDGLATGTYDVESWHFDNNFGADNINIEFREQGGSTLFTLPSSLSTDAAEYQISVESGTAYELVFRENNGNNRTRFNGIRITRPSAPAPEPSTLGLAAFGILGLSVLGRRRRTRTAALCLFACALTICVGSTANATVILQYDVNDNDDADSITQPGWIATNEDNINDVTFTAVGVGVTLADRDRNAGNGGGAEAAMWRDFIFAENSNAAGEGLDITITNLPENTTIDVRLWAFDENSNGGRNALWNGNALSFPSGPDPTSLDDYVVSFQATTDNVGTLVLEGRYASGSLANNVFVNGFELSFGRTAPEPSAALLAMLGAMGLCFRRRCRR